MPLSEQEQRLLDEMERSLYHNDADFVATVGQRRGRPNYTTLVVGILIGVVGVATLVTGVVIGQPPIGVIVGVLGFAIMFAGVLVAMSPGKGVGPMPASSAPRAPRSKARSGFMDQLNDRWERRQDGRD